MDQLNLDVGEPGDLLGEERILLGGLATDHRTKHPKSLAGLPLKFLDHRIAGGGGCL